MVMPAPVQGRAHETIRRAIEATAALVDEKGVSGVRLQDVVARSGVSIGSLTHHFESRDGLIAAALMHRFDDAAAQRAATFDLAIDDPDRFAAGLAAILASSAAGERDAWRMARVRALAYARHRPLLREALAVPIVALQQQMGQYLAAGTTRLRDGASVSPLALVVYSESYSAGRIVDTVFGEPLLAQEWSGLFARLVRGIVDERVVEAALGVPDPDAGTSFVRPAEHHEDRPDIPRLDLTADERRMLDAAIVLQRVGGADALLIQDLARVTGLSRSWFARHFGERDDLLDLVHLANLVGFSVAASASIEQAFDGAVDGEDLRDRLDGLITLMSRAEAISGAWDRMQLIAGASARPTLALQAAPIVHATIDRTAAAIAGAQTRGLVHPDISPRAAARALWATPISFVLGEVVGVEWDELQTIAQRSIRTWLIS